MKHFINVWTCDRCNTKAEVPYNQNNRSYPPMVGWTTIEIQTEGVQDGRICHFCPPCTEVAILSGIKK